MIATTNSSIDSQYTSFLVSSIAPRGLASVACRLHGWQKIEEMKVIARSNRFLALALMLSLTALQRCCTALIANRIALKTSRKEFRRFCASSVITDNSKVTGRTRELISDGVRSALESAFGSEAPGAEPMVITSKGDFGDYQCNAALPLAKLLGAKPKDVAAKLMSTIQADVDMSKLISSMDISGPGFINIHLSDSYMREKLTTMVKTPERLGMEPVSGASRQRVIVDFSSPNIAKEMHVGHLRSTIIGDSLSRVLEFLGHDVVRLNHVGDWGTQFGMLIRFMQEKQGETREQTQEGASVSIRDDIGLGDLVQFYKAAKKRFDEDPQFEKASREEVVLLQSGDEGSLKAWNSICDLSRAEFNKIYDILEVQINERGESFYNPMLASLVQELESSGKAVQSEGATCIFLPGYSNPDGTPQPMIIKKSDGGFLYATTDLAAIRQRSRDEKADRVLYVTDVGQSQHFEMVFKAARSSNLLTEKTELRHVPFGLVQGEDGKKFKTRSGDTVRLKDLLDQAVSTAEEDMLLRLNSGAKGDVTEGEKILELSDEDKAVARIVGIGAVKYADLSMNRESNYRFSYRKMLSLTGNTAPYMLYAFARIQGIQRKALAAVAGIEDSVASKEQQQSAALLQDLDANSFDLTTKEEQALAKQLMRLDEVLEEVSRDLYPNKLCEYLFELSQRFNQFYERCPVLAAETPQLRKSRAALCSLTADTLKLSLDLLGIRTVEKL